MEDKKNYRPFSCFTKGRPRTHPSIKVSALIVGVFIILTLFLACPGADAKSDLITVDFKDTDIKDVLRAIAAQQEVNIVADEGLKAKVTIYLSNVPFEEGLSALLSAHGLTYEKEGEIYRVRAIEVKKPYTLTVTEGLLSLDAQRAEINQLLQEISARGGFSIVTDKSVKGEVSVYLNKVPIKTGLETVLKAGGFPYKVVNNIYVVGGDEEAGISTIKVEDGLLSLDLKGVDILRVLREIAIQSGLSIVADKSVTGVVSSHLEKVPLETGLKALLETNDFSCEKVNDIFQVSKAEKKVAFSVSVDEEGLFTLDVKSAELDELLRAISRQGKVDIVTADYVRGKVNAHLSKASLDKVLKLVLEGTNFTYALVDGTYIVGEGVSLKPNTLTFLISEVIKINWLKAEDIITILPDAFPKSNVKLLKDQNALAVVGTKVMIEKLVSFVEQIDQPVPQIMIEALVVEFRKDWDRNIGLSTVSTAHKNTLLNLFPGKVEPLSLTYHVAKDMSREFSLTLEAMVREGVARVKANPRIATLNGHEATIDVVTVNRYREHRYNERTGVLEPVGVPRTIEAGIKLKIKPWVTASDKINVEVIPEISNATGLTSEDGLPQTSERKVQTTIRVKNGETIIIGGLIQSEEREIVNGLPFLSRIPILGYLFSQREKVTNQSELVIYITPHLLPGVKVEED